MDCASICGVSFPVDVAEGEPELLRSLYSASVRLGPPGACYVLCRAVDKLCASLGDCRAALKEFVKRYQKVAELYRQELIRIAASEEQLQRP